jgi:hypothetical protein
VKPLLRDGYIKDAAVGRMRQEYLQLPEIGVGIRVPEGRQAKTMRLVRAARDVSFSLEDAYAVATIPTLHIAEMVHLGLA